MTLIHPPQVSSSPSSTLPVHAVTSLRISKFLKRYARVVNKRISFKCISLELIPQKSHLAALPARKHPYVLRADGVPTGTEHGLVSMRSNNIGFKSGMKILVSKEVCKYVSSNLSMTNGRHLHAGLATMRSLSISMKKNSSTLCSSLPLQR